MHNLSEYSRQKESGVIRGGERDLIAARLRIGVADGSAGTGVRGGRAITEVPAVARVLAAGGGGGEGAGDAALPGASEHRGHGQWRLDPPGKGEAHGCCLAVGDGGSDVEGACGAGLAADEARGCIQAESDG